MFSSASAITGSIDRTLAHASFDKQTVAEQSRTARDKPKHVGEGLLMGVGEVVKGFGMGAMNLFAKPIDGAIHDGAKGFFTGVGKGLLGKRVDGMHWAQSVRQCGSFEFVLLTFMKL